MDTSTRFADSSETLFHRIWRRVLLALVRACVALTLLTEGTVQAFDATVTKLHGRSDVSQEYSFFGSSVAINDRYILIGGDRPSNQGSARQPAHLFDAKTGRYLRKLVPDRSGRNGNVVALQGELAIVCDQVGNVYGFNARTGRQVWTLSGSFGGHSVSVSGDRLLVADIYETVDSLYAAGQAHLFDISVTPPTLVASLNRGDQVRASEYFGSPVSICGNIAAVGGVHSDFVHLYDATDGSLLKVIESNRSFSNFRQSLAVGGGKLAIVESTNIRIFDIDGGMNEASISPLDMNGAGAYFCVALCGDFLLVGAYGEDPAQVVDAGAAYLFRASTGELVRRFEAPDPATNDQFGTGIAFFGNRAVIGARLDDDLAEASGAAYLFRDISGPLPLSSVAKSQNFAPGIIAGNFHAFDVSVLNPEGETAFGARLAGSGIVGRKARYGFWSNAGTGGVLGMVAQGSTDLGGGLAVDPRRSPIFNQPDELILQGSTRGTGGHGSALLRSTHGGTPTAFLQKGDAVPDFPGALLNRFFDVSQSHSGSEAEVATSIQFQIGSGGVRRINDTGILAVDTEGVLWDSFRENLPLDAQAGVAWAQFAPRSTMVGEETAWSSFLKGPAVSPADNVGLFQAAPGAGSESQVARKGDLQAAGGIIRSFHGEAINPDEVVAYRVKLTRAGRANERLMFGSDVVWTRRSPVDAIDPDIAPNARIVRLLKYWPASGGRVFFLAKLAGPGVNASNDCALLLWENGITQFLMREGEPAFVGDGARIRAIQRVDVEPATGRYVILAALTGSPSANQALFRGRTEFGNATDLQVVRHPVMAMRKGVTYRGTFGEAKQIVSLSLSDTCDRFGAGAKGGPQVINEAGEIVVHAVLSDRTQVILTGAP